MALKIKQELPDGADPKTDVGEDAVQDEERASHASSRPGSASPAPPRSTPSASTPVNPNTTTTTPASSPHAPLPAHLLVNGSPKSPSEEGGLCSNNNTLSSNNNLLSGGLLGPHNGLFMGPVPPVGLPGHAHSLSNLLRDSDALKGPFRFDEQRSPFRFSEDRSLTPNGVMMGRLGESLIPKGDPMEARLQEMLRYNMDKYANQNLDTLNIARRVRELLSIHNIGQRLFAKYVLGLSQGTVSELLSKPKPWDKLTEKGRDSYRKMHAWACDEHSVMLLKSLIPKKGKEASLPPFIANETPDMTDERIAHILSEASQLMRAHNPDELRSNEDSRSPADNRGESASPMNSKDGSPSRKVRKYENDDIPQEKVVRIYQEELAKIMGRRLEESMRGRPGLGAGDQPFPGLLFPHFMEGGLPLAARSQDDIRLALDTYHRELAKLNMAPSMDGLTPPVGLPGLLALQQQALAQQAHAMERKSESRDGREVNGSERGSESGDPRERGERGERGVASDSSAERIKKEMAEVTAEALRHGTSAFSLVRPKGEPGAPTASPLGNSILPPDQAGSDLSGTAAVSPLQRMASITNSLISQQASAPTHTTQSPRPLKAVLPPITQQQFDQFNNLNTEEIVRKVKESLSQYSISQRLFGENVLGLSQGSVSDLLARPKPWHMLTQKGREPFIRMKMFLEDDNAVHKLVASQYKIAPEKLMRTGGYGVNPPIPSSRSHPAASRLANLPEDMLSRLSDQHAHSKAALLQHMAAHPHHGGHHAGHPVHHGGQALAPPPPPLLGSPPSHPASHPASHHAARLGGHHPGHLPHDQPPRTTTPQQQQQQQQREQAREREQREREQRERDREQQVRDQHRGPSPSQLRGLQPHLAPSVYEMAALTSDLDTQTITTKIKETLLANNIGQKIFGEVVLGLSQGSVSELLSKPKPWHMLSIKGREPFIRMQLWLSDPVNIDRLQALRNERREASKRRRGSGVNSAASTPGDNSSDTSSNDTSEFYHSTSPGPPAKKQRVLFSEEQKEALRLAFALDSYPNVGTIEFLANELQLSSRTITNWFHNHRMRLKQQVPHSPASPSPREQTSPGQTFDPVRFRMLLNQRLVELQKERLGGAGLPLPYPPYFTGNANLAALISRGLLPAAGFAGLAGPEPKDFNGLDLSIKRESDYEDDDNDAISNPGSEDSAGDLARRTPKPSEGLTPPGPPGSSSSGPPRSSSSRRKPAAPQWVNPDWQEAKDKEVIINGVCVMQTDDYKLPSQEETVRVEPQAVLDRFERVDDDSDDALSPQNLQAGGAASGANSPQGSLLGPGDADDDQEDMDVDRRTAGEAEDHEERPQERRHNHGGLGIPMDEVEEDRDRPSPSCSPVQQDADQALS